MDWNVVAINTLVETNVPTEEQKECNFFEEYLNTSTIISPWYRNFLPIQVIYKLCILIIFKLI